MWSLGYDAVLVVNIEIYLKSSCIHLYTAIKYS